MEKTLSIYSRRFDKNSINWEENMGHDMFFIRSTEKYFNDLLKARGYVFLRDVYEYFGICPISKESIVVGWYYDQKNKLGDNHIDFEVIEGPDYFDLDFNVDGSILERF